MISLDVLKTEPENSEGRRTVVKPVAGCEIAMDILIERLSLK